MIFSELANLEVEPNLLDAAEENVLRQIESFPESNEAILQSQQADLEECEKRLRRLADMWLDGVMTDPERYRELETRELARKSEITFEMERLQHQIDTSKMNLARSIRFLKDARSILKSDDAGVKKEIFRALATSYVFDGHAKTITTKIHPLLTEMVSFARSLKGLEPQKMGSGSKRKLPLTEAVFVGGDSKSGLESIAPLHEHLRGELFPDLCLTDEVREPVVSANLKSIEQPGSTEQIPTESIASGHFDGHEHQSTSRSPGRRSSVRSGFGSKRTSRIGNRDESTRQSLPDGAAFDAIH